MKVLCTFSGKYGDILWSLPTARQIAKDIAGEPVDFAMMPYYESLCPLIEAQEYISKCFVIPNWIRTHSNHGDGPSEAPTIANGVQVSQTHYADEFRDSTTTFTQVYDKIFHLTYKAHPGISAPSMALVDFVAYQQGIQLEQPVVPFLKAKQLERPGVQMLIVSYAFNEQYAEPKKAFLDALLGKEEFSTAGDSFVFFSDVTKLEWADAARRIETSDLFIGCRSANWVVAMGLGKQTITYEPHPSRHATCHLGKVFGCPYGQEIPLPYFMPPAVAAEAAAGMIRKKLEEIKNAGREEAVGQTG